MNHLIAIVGMSGAGKSVVTDYLESVGWIKLYFGGITYKLMAEAGIERTSDGKSEKEFREKLRNDYGPECYAKFMEPEIREQIKTKNVVLDGLYSWYEYKYLIDKFPDLKLICVVTDKDLRYERVGKREDRPFDLEAIRFRDISEIENLFKGGPIAYADYYILNNNGKDDVLNRLQEILTKMEEEV